MPNSLRARLKNLVHKGVLSQKDLDRIVIVPVDGIGDLISRQAAIDAIEDDNRNGMWSCFTSDADAQKFKKIIANLPPIIVTHCENAISRELVLREIDKYMCGVPFEEGIDEVIKRLPPVSVAEKVGEWIPYDDEDDTTWPEDGTWNLFTNGKQCSVERFKVDALNHFFPDGRWFKLDDVVAWMPLPQPYKGEREDNEK